MVAIAWTVCCVLHFMYGLIEGLHCSWITDCIHDECAKVAIFVPHVLQYKRSTYWRTLTPCAWRGRVVEIVPATMEEWAASKCRGWGSWSCSCKQIRLAELRYTRPCSLELKKLLVQHLICVQHRLGSYMIMDHALQLVKVQPHDCAEMCH